MPIRPQLPPGAVCAVPPGGVGCSALVASAISDRALVSAWQHVQENQGGPGTDGITLERFGQNLFTYLGRLRLQVQSGTYLPGPLRQAAMPKGEGKGPRLLAIPNIRDRVLQTAVGHLLRRLIDPVFHDGSFGYRPGRSARMAIEQIIRLRDDGYHWVVDADIQHFFDEIDRPLLAEKLMRACRDEGVVELVAAWLRAPIQMPDKTFLRPERGVPQGAPISPLLANLYLDEFDRQLEASGGRIVRYADDFLILFKKQEHLAAARELTETHLQQLKLCLNTDKTRLSGFEAGFSFLGVRFQGDSITPEKPESAAWLMPLPQVAFTREATANNDRSERPPRVESAELHHATQPPPWEEVNSETARPHLPHEQEALAEGDEAVIEVDSEAPPHLRTLYLLTPGLLLSRANDRLTVSSRGAALRDVAIQTIDQVLALGPCTFTSPALMLCTEYGVGLHVIDTRRKVTASLAAAGAESVQLRRAQYRACADDATCLRLATLMVCGKIANSRAIIARFLRHHPVSEGEAGLTQLRHLADDARRAQTLDALRGYEGAAARVYFGLMRAMLPQTWSFGARLSHPPADPVNALLSYGYAVLYGNCATLVQRRGLDPAFAFLHAPREGHLALASDLIEPYRAAIVDAVVMSLIFRNRVRSDDFAVDEDAALPCLINESAKRTLIHALEEKFNSRPAGSSQDYRRLMAQDVAQLARHIEGLSPLWEPWAI